VLRSRLYRKFRLGVILAGLMAVCGHALFAQMERRAKVDKGPRALGLVVMAPNGKAHLIPVAIMYDGQFYDASVYKASPVPMALDTGTVYEVEKSGKSLGLFTVAGALQGRGSWTGAGTFEPAGSKPKSQGQIAKSVPRDIDIDSGPPKLRRPASEKNKPEEPAPKPAQAAPATPSAAPASSSAPASPAPTSPAPTLQKPAPTAGSTAASTATPKAEVAPPQQDVDRPVLRRGKPEWTLGKPPAMPEDAPVAEAKASASGKAAVGAIQIIPAISDAGGPEPHPFSYAMKPDEEQEIRKKVLAMAADQVLARVKLLSSEEIGAPTGKHATRHTRAAKAPQPIFEDVQLHVFDLSLSNEPVAVLTATAHMPASAKGAPGLQYYVAVVAHEDIYGDLHKAFSQVTDNHHLDVLARYEFIDAVDADGNGRGDLLFRTVSDAGQAYTIYRLIGDQVWPLFEGTPGQ